MIVVLPVSIYFFFWVANHSEGFSAIFSKFSARLPAKAQYALGCAFCFSFWASLVIVPLNNLPLYLVATTPVLSMFLNLAFLALYKYTS